MGLTQTGNSCVPKIIAWHGYGGLFFLKSFIRFSFSERNDSVHFVLYYVNLDAIAFWQRGQLFKSSGQSQITHHVTFFDFICRCCANDFRTNQMMGD